MPSDLSTSWQKPQTPYYCRLPGSAREIWVVGSFDIFWEGGRVWGVGVLGKHLEHTFIETAKLLAVNPEALKKLRLVINENLRVQREVRNRFHTSMCPMD